MLRTFILRPFYILLSLYLLSACTPVGLAVGAGATAGSIIMETRSLDDSIKDRGIQADINQRLADKSLETFTSITIDVVEGRVLLTGIVTTQERRLDVAKISWETEGVEEVVNEILVSSNIGLIDVSSDIWIKTQLVSSITFDKHVLATNYEISVIGGRVYLFGISVDDAETERVIAHAREVPSVRQVISHMRNMDDPLRVKRLERIAAQKS